MTSSSVLYINVVKLPNQLKIDYKMLKGGNITKSDQTSFLIYDELMTKDIVFRLDSLQKENKNNYISTVLNSKEQFICSDDDLSKYSTNEYDFVKLYNKKTVVTPKSVVFETKHYFEKSGIDYIFSPYQILTHYVLDNPSKNNMLVLIISNLVYVLITDANSNPIYYVIKELTPFDDIKNSQFYDDEIIGQKLFDEIYFYELQDILKEVLEEFYAIKADSFVEKINILYTLKQLDNEQIDTLKEEFMMDISYHPISLDSYMYELANSKVAKKSFILPRKKTPIVENYIWIVGSIIATLLTIYLLYSFYDAKRDSYLPVKDAQTEQATQNILSSVELSDHISKNIAITSLVKQIFSSIPYNVVLNELILDVNDSILVCDFLEKDTFVTIMKPNMLEIYSQTTIMFDEDNETTKPVIVGVIKNTNQSPSTAQTPKTLSYKQSSFSFTMMNDIIKKEMDSTWQIVYLKTLSNEDFNMNLFELSLDVKEPREFFDFIDKINSLDYSISIEHPLKFTKSSDSDLVNIKLILSFNQANLGESE